MSNNDDLQEFINEALQYHNYYRKLHGAPALKYCNLLQNSAQQWADAIITATKLTNSDLSKSGEVGENISLRTSGSSFVDLSSYNVIDQWYKDSAQYNFDTQTGPAGNFTQMIWHDSQEIGFGKAYTKGRCVIVAHYRPPGNIRGRYAQNVFPLKNVGSSSPGRNRNNEDIINKEMTTIVDFSRGGNSPVTQQDISEYQDKSGTLTTKLQSFQLESPEQDDEGDDTDSEKNETFINDVLNRHNFYRSKHDSDPLELDPILCQKAQNWADTLSEQSFLSNSNTLFNDSRVGENIASRWGNGPCDVSGNFIADHWYEENKRFRYHEEPDSVQGIGNFSQMIWAQSKALGVGKSRRFDENGCCRVIVVCHYAPPGNVFKHFCDNVKMPTS